MLDISRSCLLVIDVQEKLLPTIIEADALVKGCVDLVGLAAHLNVPTLATEQYPEGVGHLAPELLEVIDSSLIHGKTAFSCASSSEFMEAFNALNGVEQVVICGMETHACVMQSALELSAAGKDVYVVVDAISSRSDVDTDTAVARMREAGITMITKEMVGFEWLRTSTHEGFRYFSKHFLR